MIFYKYHGTGNDFVLVDNRKGDITITTEQVQKMCERHFGIGADGLILVETDPEVDFSMIYYNSDGNVSSMCGNGGRCVVKFARLMGIISENSTLFRAADGIHTAKILKDGNIALQMNVSNDHELYGQAYILNTGSPHYVRFRFGIDRLNMIKEGRNVRNSPKFKREGINVNIVEEMPDRLQIRTYERGVENETLSCGTGVVAAAVSWYFKERKKNNEIVHVETKGGNVAVELHGNEHGKIETAWLIGPAREVFIGEVDI